MEMEHATTIAQTTDEGRQMVAVDSNPSQKPGMQSGVCRDISENASQALMLPKRQGLIEVLEEARATDQIVINEIDQKVEDDFKVWSEEWLREHPNRGMTPDLEFRFRENARQLEATKRGVPTLVRPATFQETSLLLNSFANCEVKGFQDAMSASSKRPSEVVQELVLEQSPTIVSAQPHCLKSFSWLQACIEAPTRNEVWGHFRAPNVKNSLFIETEDPPWLVEARIRWIAKGIGLTEEDEIPGFRYFCPGAFDLVKQIAELEQLLIKYKPDFVVLSTLQNILGGRDWKEPSQMSDVNALIVRLSRLYCPIILITHSPWDKKLKRPAGSVTIAANFPTALHYEKCAVKKTKQTSVSVILDSKLGAVKSFHLDVIIVPDAIDDDPRSIHLAYGGEGRQKGSGKEGIRAALMDDPNSKSADIAERLSVSPRYVNMVREEMTEESKALKEHRTTRKQHASAE